MSDNPWSGATAETVHLADGEWSLRWLNDCDPAEQAAVRHYLAGPDGELEQARNLAVALEQRLEEVRQFALLFVTSYLGQQIVALISEPLAVVTEPS
jgi:hypothetical protein